MKRLFSYALLSLITGTYLLTGSSSFAQESSLSVYPPVIEVQATPPSSPSLPIFIQNNSNDEVNLTIELIPFKTNNVSGDIQLILTEQENEKSKYIKKRVQFLDKDIKADKINLQPLEGREILLNINLAKGDPPGDYYYSIIFTNQRLFENDSSSSTIPHSIATNLLLSIGPKQKSLGGISEFKTSYFKTQGPVDFELKLHNASSHLIVPTGSVIITNIFGQEVGNVDILPQYVLAGADRYLLDNQKSTPSATTTLESLPTTTWSEKFLLGWYKATALITLDDNGEKIQKSTSFVAFPLYMFFPLFIAIFIIISVYLRVRKAIKLKHIGKK